MFDFLTRQPALLIPALALLLPIVGVVAYYWHAARRAELDTRLKEELLRRGMSADEIVRVIEAGRTPDDDADQQHSTTTAPR